MSYPGGKGSCYRRIVNLMPPHRTYIETHLGGGAVMLQKRPAAQSIGIDIDGDVIARWFASDLGPRPLLLEHGDAATFLDDYPWDGGELVYCDPPYVHSTRAKANMYAHEMSDDDHRRLLSVLRTLPCQVMVSGYRCELYDLALADWRVEAIPNVTRGGSRIEAVWLNFDPPPVPHDVRFLGDTFRERERIQRQRRRWARRFAKLPPAEQAGILETLLDCASPDVASRASIAENGEEN